MDTITLTVNKMAHGGKAIGEHRGRRVFVAGALPGEKVKVRVVREKGRVMEAEIEAVLKPSRDRVQPQCLPDDVSIADFQHVAYAAQLRLKQAVVRDQFLRLGRLGDVKVEEVLPNPNPWNYRIEATLSPTRDGRLGYWSRKQRKVIRATPHDVLAPVLQNAIRDIDLELPDLRKLTLRVGSDDEVLLVFAMEEAEPPEIEIDFPVSVALVMPDGVAATLIGDPFLVQEVRGQTFRVSAGCDFPASIAGAEMLVDAVMQMANLTGNEVVIDCFSGVGMLARFLADRCAELIGIEKNPDAIEDAAVNLDATENVALYNDWLEDALPIVDVSADLILIDSDDKGLSKEAMQAIVNKRAPRIIYSNPNVATAARDARGLKEGGYRCVEIRPIDTLPQTFQIHTVTLWER